MPARCSKYSFQKQTKRNYTTTIFFLVSMTTMGGQCIGQLAPRARNRVAAQIRLEAETGRVLRAKENLRLAKEQDTAMFQNSNVLGAFHPKNMAYISQCVGAGSDGRC